MYIAFLAIFLTHLFIFAVTFYVCFLCNRTILKWFLDECFHYSIICGNQNRTFLQWLNHKCMNTTPYHNGYQPIKRDRFKARKICRKLSKRKRMSWRRKYDTIIWFHEFTHLLFKYVFIQWREEITLKAMKILFILIFKAMNRKRMGI
jgi:hypothetical protein